LGEGGERCEAEQQKGGGDGQAVAQGGTSFDGNGSREF
jgi:hypothetical protein